MNNRNLSHLRQIIGNLLRFWSPKVLNESTFMRSDGNPLTKKMEHNKTKGVLEIPDVQQEDEGSYECIAGNSRGRNIARGQLFVYALPEWDKKIQNAFLSLYDSLFWECKAKGKPSPSYSWLKNGQALASELQHLIFPKIL
ncbi:hypothetical protein llap_18921 [Limosa lapponica baueri]|uniref:Immunoglobulin I-set domain-containing protein n=1 Tax=Limosa lapponica baueri TaxID=1758121 RepID=A0A2I0TAG6_LIMLA|nr:hypothetical protein llap_18921 [Limosa lapponica baueri]